MEDKVRMMLDSRGLPFKPCGLNADWCVSAWHLSDGEPNTNSGDFYLLDTEDTNGDGVELFEIVQRNHLPEDKEGNDDVRRAYGPDTLEKVVNQFVFKQPENDEFFNQCPGCAQPNGSDHLDGCWVNKGQGGAEVDRS